MPFGIIFDGVTPALSANFYIPSSSFNTSASHVYLGWAPKPTITETLRTTQKTVLVEMQRPAGEFLEFLKECIVAMSRPNVAVVVSLSDDSDLFVQLKNSHLPLVLRYHFPIPPLTLEQFKCLNYSAVLVADTLDNVDKAQISRLLAKTTTPSLITFQHLVKEPSEWQSLATVALPPFTDLLITPLQPLVQDLPVSVYEEFEKDSSKYSQYQRAISMALGDLRHSKKNVNVLVVGPGRGPLLEMVIEHTSVQDSITVVEKNPTCLPFLRNICKTNPVISLIHGDCRQLADLASYDLVVSELLGSFGCNEACPEILSFASDAVFIPETFSSFLHPMYSDVLDGISTSLESAEPGPISAPLYLAKLNSAYSPCKPQEIFDFDFPGKNNLNQKKTVCFSGGTGVPANALCGYFQATLYGPYKISIMPGSYAGEYCQSWFPMVFPMKEVEYPVTVEMRRCSTHTLWYEYTVNGISYQSSEIALGI